MVGGTVLVLWAVWVGMTERYDRGGMAGRREEGCVGRRKNPTLSGGVVDTEVVAIRVNDTEVPTAPGTLGQVIRDRPL